MGPGGSHWGFWLYTGHLLTIWGIALSNLFLGLMILWSAFHRRRWRRSWASVEPLLAPLGIYAVVLIAAVASSYHPLASAGGLKELFSLATLALGVVLVRGERQVRLVVALLSATIALLAVYGIAQYYFTGFGDLNNRIVALFSHYQTYAGVLLLGDLLLFARLLARRFDRWHWLALAVVNWALALTLTRGAWVAAAATIFVFGLFTLRRSRAYALILVMIAALAAAFYAPQPWRGRVRSILDLQDNSNYDRLCMIEAGLAMVSEQPLFGIGPRMVRKLYPIYRNPSGPRLTVPHLHNAFLDLAAERGLLSLAAYFWLVGSSFRLAFRAYRREGGLRGERADLHLATMLTLAGFNVAALFENNWGDTEVQRLVLFFLAVPCCLDPAESDRPQPSALALQ